MPEVYKIYMVRMTVKGLTKLRIKKSKDSRYRNVTTLIFEWLVR